MARTTASPTHRQAGLTARVRAARSAAFAVALLDAQLGERFARQEQTSGVADLGDLELGSSIPGSEGIAAKAPQWSGITIRCGRSSEISFSVSSCCSRS